VFALMRLTKLPMPSLLIALAMATCAHAADSVSVSRVPDSGLYPQAQTDLVGRLHLIYFKGDAARGDIFYVRSDDDGVTLTRPLRVNSEPQSALIIGTVRGPQLAVGKDSRVHVAWMGSQQPAPMLYTRLNDARDAFEPQRDVIASHPGLDGGGSIAAEADGHVYVAWHAPADATSPTEADRRLWVTRSDDNGKTFAAERAAIDEPTGACGCCGMKFFADASGRMLIVYRSAREKVNRDIHLLVSSDHAQSFSIAGVDPWHIGKCVMSTASIASTNQTTIAAWETRGQIILSALPAGAGHTGASVAVPGEGQNRKHPSLAINSKGQCLVVWTEGTSFGKGGSIAWQQFDAQLKPIDATAGHADGLHANSLPATFVARDQSFRIVY
jgi:hypothetical protein